MERLVYRASFAEIGSTEPRYLDSGTVVIVQIIFPRGAF